MTDDRVRVPIGEYLAHAAEKYGDEWRLVHQTVTDGDVLLQPPRYEALREPDETHGSTGSDYDGDHEFDGECDPEKFPPCMAALLDRVREGDHLEHRARFALGSFLASIGLDTDEITQLLEIGEGFGRRATEYQIDHIRGDYDPPSCATLQRHGLCVELDDRCETIAHPLAYYDGALD